MGCNWQGDRNPGHARRIAMWQEIEAEFDEPIRDVIMGLREQGNTWRTVAGALGVSLSVLQAWRCALGLPLNRHEQTYDPSSPAVRRKSDTHAQALGYADAPSAIAEMRLQGMTLKEIGARLDLHWQTVSVCTPPKLRGLRGKSAGGREVHRRLARSRKRGGRDHPWSKDNEHVFVGT